MKTFWFCKKCNILVLSSLINGKEGEEEEKQKQQEEEEENHSTAFILVLIRIDKSRHFPHVATRGCSKHAFAKPIHRD